MFGRRLHAVLLSTTSASSASAMMVDALYLSHAVLELALGLIKLRGRYSHEVGVKPPRAQMYVRHHGFSLLALSLLGALTWQRGLAHDARCGGMVSAVLAVFHGGACLSFFAAWAEGAIPAAKVVVPHGPWAAAFAWHWLVAG